MPVRIDFYILPQNSHQSASLQFVCKLAEKIYRLKQRLFILCESRAALEQLDKLLWAFDAISFVPHLSTNQVGGEKDLSSVILGCDPFFSSEFSVLINLTTSMPKNYQSYQRVVEIVYGDEDNRKIFRQRYKQYQNEQCQLVTHSINY